MLYFFIIIMQHAIKLSQTIICTYKFFFLPLPKIIRMNIAENIKRAYKLHGLTGTEVARKLGIVQPQFSRLINNPKIKVEDLEKIADAIGCSVVDLIDPSVSNDNMQKYCPYCGKKLK